MKKNEITKVQIEWMVQALNMYIGTIRNEMENAGDDSPVCAFGEMLIEGRKSLVTKLTDIINSDVKTVRIV